MLTETPKSLLSLTHWIDANFYFKPEIVGDHRSEFKYMTDGKFSYIVLVYKDSPYFDKWRMLIKKTHCLQCERVKALFKYECRADMLKRFNCKACFKGSGTRKTPLVGWETVLTNL